MDDAITVMGVKIRRSPVSSVCERRCEYLKNGFCRKCTCTECEGGFLIAEWREKELHGDHSHGPRECRCVESARSRRRLREAGLEALAARCSFESFRTEKPWQQAVKRKAEEYLAEAKKTGFFISGQSGCGKTHLCTAICNALIEQGGRLLFFQWVRDGTRLKQLVTERDGGYEKEIAALIQTQYLYIDDLFKQEVTAADVRLAYEILNGRYNAGRPTIFSSERDLNYIRDARDGEGAAIAGRIYEDCGRGRYYLNLTGREKDQRFAG